jgi:pyruvate/2-oxoglutarate dehydrogenase complex dihydrolipoamide dehydrogenase (E3) component/uncharacterized membrane protein YdjX (TVP38/TMEM64 family)
MSKSKILVACLFLASVYGFFAFDLAQYFSLDFFKAQQAQITAYYEARPVWTALVYCLIYVAVTALSLPGAALMTLAGGAVFGLVLGTALVSIASTVGATLAFLVSRFLLREAIQDRFGESLVAFNDGIEKDGAFYLFTLRLVPAFPFFVINLVMGLTPIRTVTFMLISWIGMFAGTLVYVNAGTQIAQIESLRGILSPGLIASFTLLGFFPLVAKKAVDFARSHKALRGWPRPAAFDRDIVVIGAGAAGLVSAYIAAAVKAKVTLVERHRMGGDCLNSGCVPSKALIRSAKVLSTVRHAENYGLKSTTVEFDFAEVMARVRRVISKIEPHDSVERYSALGVDCVLGEAKITSPYTVVVGDRTLTTRNIIIAAGARPWVPPIPGVDQVDYLTSDSLWDIDALPDRLIVLGGGPIGCELAQAFARFGSRVTQVEMLPRLLIREDPEISEMIARRFQAEGVDLRLAHKALRFIQRDGGHVLVCEHAEREVEIPFDRVLVAVGRRATTEGYGLEELGIELTPQGTVAVNEHLQTRFPNIYACGDVAGPYQFTHTASHQAWYAAVNSLFGSFWRFKADYSVIPWATFTDPEVARVGLNETEATEQGVDYEVTTYGIDDLDRAIADEADLGLVKVLTVPGKDRVLGATIVGDHAGDLITEYVSAMRHGFGMNKILGTIHIYPTLAEANKYAAGEWKRAHAPQRLLSWLERFHAWRRG